MSIFIMENILIITEGTKNVTVFGLLSSQKYNSSDHIQLRSHTAQITQQVIELTS